VTFKNAHQVEDDSQVVTGCSFHNGLGAAFELHNSTYVDMSDNIVFRHTQFGLYVKDSSNWNFDNNKIFHIRQRVWLEILDSFLDFEGGIIYCPYYGNKCFDYTVTNNIVGGTYYMGLGAYGIPCGEKETNRKNYNNIVHTSERACTVLFADEVDPNINGCQEFAYSKNYKC